MHYPRQQNLYVSFLFFRQLLPVVVKIHAAHGSVKMAQINQLTVDRRGHFQIIKFFF